MREPGHYADYPSRMVSKFYCWCKDQGYPELDVRQYSDGSWALIQYLHAPIVPSLTKWQPVLMDIQNVEISPQFIKHHADKLNLEKSHVWDDVARNERRIVEEIDKEETYAHDMARRKTEIVKRAPGLMDRIARRGAKELDPRRLIQHIDVRDLSKKDRQGIKRL